MDNQLKTLISLLEEEKLRLEQLIQACVMDQEYLMAHYHFQALRQLNFKLQTLQNIDDKLYDRKETKRNWIAYMEKVLADETSDFAKLYYSSELEKAKAELARLNQIPTESTPSDKLPLLDQVLEKVMRKKVKNVKLMLSKTNNLFLSFNYSNKILNVALPGVKKHQKKWIINDKEIASFKNLGFRFDEGERKLMLAIEGDKEDVLFNVKLVLSKIVFEIFYFRQFDNESYILFTEKRGY